jgi:uncharacterized protein with PQ loop repeat
MNKLDKQFEQMMRGIQIDSPSSDFTLRVMSRIQAEAAVQRQPILQNYQPVISKRTWIILIVAFVLLLIYITVSSRNAAPAGDTGFWSTVSGKIGGLNNQEASSILKTGMGLFTSIPPIAYLILTASLALWTLDSILTQFRHQHSRIQTN